MQMIHPKTGPWVFAGLRANSFYHDMINTIKLEGERAAPRGLPTTELLHCITRVEIPQCRVLTVPGRGLNPFFNMAEALWILNGKSEAWWILYFNSQLAKYLDPPLTSFYGAYGERLRKWPQVKAINYSMGQDIEVVDQLMDCYWTLHNAPESRQAAMILRNPRTDKNSAVTHDRPCNIAVTFKLRHNQLFMTVFNRSNDVILGLTSTNIVQFSTIQETLASWLGVSTGPYSHYSDSLHLYDSQDLTGQIGFFDVYDYVSPTIMKPMSPAESDAMRTRLYDYLGNLIKIHMIHMQNQLSAEDLKKTLLGEMQQAPPREFPCQYWNSVCNALLAYVAHRSMKDWKLALSYIGEMKTPDWQIECLRFFADRYYIPETDMAQSDDFCTVASVIFDQLPLRGGLAAAQAVWKYIFQSAHVAPEAPPLTK